MVARHLQDTGGGRTFNRFTDYLSPEAVDERVLRHHLRQVERSAQRFLFPAAVKQLRDAGHGP